MDENTREALEKLNRTRAVRWRQRAGDAFALTVFTALMFIAVAQNFQSAGADTAHVCELRGSL